MGPSEIPVFVILCLTTSIATLSKTAFLNANGELSTPTNYACFADYRLLYIRGCLPDGMDNRVTADTCAATDGALHFSYDDDGPKHWGGFCQIGSSQSPIDLQVKSHKSDEISKLVFENYNTSGALKTEANSHTIVTTGFEEWPAVPTLSGGRLGGAYRLSQLHYHWTNQGGMGSEHEIDGQRYPIEIHFVHIKNNLSFTEALNHTDGLAVLGVFLDYNPKSGDNGISAKTVHRNVRSKRENIDEIINWKDIHFSEGDGFVHYQGSLTTPDCNEAVQWYVFTHPWTLDNLETILNDLRVHMVPEFTKNYRPLQALNGRPLQVFHGVGPGGDAPTLR